MAGIFPNETTIYIVAADTNASALAASDKIIGEVTNISRSGGEADVESIAVVGGFVDKESPRAQFEISMDVIVQNTAASTLDRYDTFQFGTDLKSSSEGSAKTIAVGHISGSFSKLTMFNNCRTVTWEPELAADDMLRGTITFKFAPTTALGVSNLKTSTIPLSGTNIPQIVWN